MATQIPVNGRAKQLGSALTKWGVKCEDRVATLMWNTGCAFIGDGTDDEIWVGTSNATTPLLASVQFCTLWLNPSDLEYIISHAQDRVIIVDAVLCTVLKQVDTAALASVELFVFVGEDAKKAIDYDELLASGDQVTPRERLEDRKERFDGDLGFLGIRVGYSQRSTYLHTLMSNGVDQLGISGRSVVLPFVPMFHVLSWGVPFNILMMGCRAVFPSHFTDAGSLLQMFGDWKLGVETKATPRKVQLSCGVPTVWQGVRAQIQKEGVSIPQHVGFLSADCRA
ncbi:Medium-chain-fatty-acid--CoA ligase [Symbiodinium microadriaticum]|uniref:Medium-chain-fatty-acid--CoA ligase n=1 Tax=Symbiodinium microadriaticum TaxID=2951 RepID=A0A1Q9C0J6_SYMMI|nr:Medium-chain-fatty-acid--CoA ligase [Symbiodinium microadriaticum]